MSSGSSPRDPASPRGPAPQDPASPRDTSGRGSARQHYFSVDPDAASHPRLLDARLGTHRVRLHVDSGVFSGSRVDLGTSVLLDAGLGVRAGTLLDLGCGYGPIALWLAQEEPTATVWGVDVNERALSLARRNAEACGVADRVRCVLPDGVPPDVCFDQIWSNPPVRIGKQALHELLAHWLPRLRPGGQAHLVVARNLGADSLAGWLRTSGWDVARVGSRKGYRLLSVERTDGRPRVF